jgi:hypothetical protein
MSEWISIEDDLPKIKDNDVYSDDVLTYCISDGVSRQFNMPNTYMEGEKYLAIDAITRWRDSSPSFRTDKFYGKVTHWMPLPKPPKESDG